MNISKSVLKQLIDDYRGGDLAEYLSTKLNSLNEIKAKLLLVYEKMDEEVSKHGNAMRELNSQLSQIQDRCPHLHRTFYGDVSGSNDPYHECDLCKRRFY